MDEQRPWRRWKLVDWCYCVDDHVLVQVALGRAMLGCRPCEWLKLPQWGPLVVKSRGVEGEDDLSPRWL